MVKFRSHNSRPGQEGQAAIEYVLMLVISVALVTMLAYQIFKPMQNFVKSYMGDYIACLLETGELPSLAGDSTVAKDEGCNARFEGATLAGGRPSKGGSGGGGSSSSSQGSSGKGKTSSRSNDDSGSEGGSGGSGGGASGSGRGIVTRGATRGADPSGKNAKVTETIVDATAGSSNSFFRSSSSTVTGAARKERSLALSSLTVEEREKIEKQRQPTGGSRVLSSEGPAIPPKKSLLKVPEPKPPAVESDAEFTLGNFLRILFIIAMVIAIVLFFGGQILQMSKNSD